MACALSAAVGQGPNQPDLGAWSPSFHTSYNPPSSLQVKDSGKITPLTPSQLCQLRAGGHL